MKKVFYDLRHTGADRPHQVYGLSKWANKFSPAEWSQKVAGLSIGRIGLHRSPRVDLTIILSSYKIGDFVWTWYGDCIVTESVLNLFREAGFTGFEPRPVVIEKIKRLRRKQREEVFIPPLWELVIKGQGGDADPKCGIHVIGRNEDSGNLEYSSFRNGIIVDEANWDGSDFFTVNGYPSFILVTECVKDLIISHQLTNCALIPSHDLEWRSGSRPEEFREERRTMASRDLASLLGDLENPDESKWMHTIFALGDKKDPGAVDALIKKFSHPDAIIWDSAATAVGEIGGYKNTPEPVRSEIFSKLMNALEDEDFRVRKSAAKALLYIGDEKSIEALMRSFEDPHESVRRTAVFVIGRLNYKPALQAVKRLTRDRSKSVRETARDVVLDLSSEF